MYFKKISLYWGGDLLPPQTDLHHSSKFKFYFKNITFTVQMNVYQECTKNEH